MMDFERLARIAEIDDSEPWRVAKLRMAAANSLIEYMLYQGTVDESTSDTGMRKAIRGILGVSGGNSITAVECRMALGDGDIVERLTKGDTVCGIHADTGEMA